MKVVLPLLLTVAVAWGRVADPPTYRELLRKIASSTELQKFMLDDPKSVMPKKSVKGDLDKTTLELIREHGYPAEEYDITSGDGYINTIHRIPHGRDTPADGSRLPVLLQHGLLCSSSDWIMQPPERALAYMLADLGYDVWLGNSRGNTYSRQHVNMTKDEPAYWTFTWNEMGQYDAPAMIDYILETTGQEQLYWIGHSMGTTMFWVMLNYHPEYNSKVRLMQGLGPVARVDHMHSIVRLLAPFANDLELVSKWLGEGEFLPEDSRWLRIAEKYFCDDTVVEEKVCRNVLFAIGGIDPAQFNLALAEWIGYNEFLPSPELMTLLAELLCEPREITDVICDDILFIMCGYDPQQLNQTALPVIISHTPAGTSTRTVIHYIQEVNSKEFTRYDWGKDENLVRYGQDTPPPYTLDVVSCPVALFWSDNDLLADPQDVSWLASRLPNIVDNYHVPLTSFSHLDYLWGIDADTLLYDHIIENLQKY